MHTLRWICLRIAWASGVLAGGAAAGCGAAGAMHQAALVGQCAGDDAACARRHPLAPIAVGSRYYPEVVAELAGAAPSLSLESAAPDIVSVEDGALLGRAAGAAAVLIATDDGSIVDFVHVWVAPVTQITLARRDGDRIAGSIALAVGEDVTLVPALWNGAQRLSGDGDLRWSTPGDDADAAPVAILRDGSASRRRLYARAPGHATITVALGDAKTSVDIDVVPGASR